jgi:hypothetical protein
MTVVEISRRTVILSAYNIAPYTYQFYLNYDYPVHATFWTDTFGISQEKSNRRYFLSGFYHAPNVRYSRELSVDLVIENERTFYWDNENQIGTAHLDHDHAPYCDILVGSYAYGFTDERQVYIDTVSYRPLVLSVPRISQSQDLQNYSIPSYLSGSVVLNNLLDNGDGALDLFIEEKLNGNDIDIFTLDAVQGKINYTRDDLTPQAAAYVEDYDFSLKQIDVRIQDRRKSQNASIPQERFFPSDYPDLEDGLIGIVVPLLYGTPVDIPAICTNGTTTYGTVEYRAALLLTVLGTVQVDTTGNGNWSTVTPVSYDLDTGSFILAEVDARDDDGLPLACRLLAPTGISITRLTDIIIDLNSRFLGFDYTATNYDTTEWATEAASISTGSYYLNSERKLADAIVDIQNGANVGFRYEILPDGRRTIRVDDEDRTPVGLISNRVIKNRDEIPVKNDISTLAAEIVVGYNKQYTSGKFSRVIDTTQKDRVGFDYGQAPRFPSDGELETLLISEADAEERAQYIIDRFSNVRGVVELELMKSDYINMRIYDIYNAELTPASWVNGSEITGREYYGIRKIKIIETDPDFKLLTNNVKAVIID